MTHTPGEYRWSIIDLRGAKGGTDDWGIVLLGFVRDPDNDRTLNGIWLPDRLVECLREIVGEHDARVTRLAAAEAFRGDS